MREPGQKQTRALVLVTCQWPDCGVQFDASKPSVMYCIDHRYAHRAGFRVNSPETDDILRARYGKDRATRIACDLGWSVERVRNRAEKLGLTRRRGAGAPLPAFDPVPTAFADHAPVVRADLERLLVAARQLRAEDLEEVTEMAEFFVTQRKQTKCEQ